jgi:hypothetical protein
MVSNILSARLKRLVAEGANFQTAKPPNPDHGQKAFDSLTEPAIELVPHLVWMGAGAPV